MVIVSGARRYTGLIIERSVLTPGASGNPPDGPWVIAVLVPALAFHLEAPELLVNR